MALAELFEYYHRQKFNILANIFASSNNVFVNYLFLLIIMRDYGRTGNMNLLRLSSLIYTDFRDHGDDAFLLGLKECKSNKLQARMNKYFTYITEVEYVKYYMSSYTYNQFLEFLPERLHEWFEFRVDIVKEI